MRGEDGCAKPRAHLAIKRHIDVRLAGSAIASSFFVPSSGLRKMVAFGQDRRRADCFRFGHGRQDMQRQFAAYFCSANNWRLGRE